MRILNLDAKSSKVQKIPIHKGWHPNPPEKARQGLNNPPPIKRNFANEEYHSQNP
jgi:hypothetical protein